MPEHLRALVFVLALAGVVFAVAKAPACAIACKPEDFSRRRNLWFALTLTVFLAHNYWVYIVVAAALLIAAQRREHNTLAVYFFVLFAVPRIPKEIIGIGFNSLFTMDYVRLLAFALLLPAYLRLRRLPGVDPFGRSLPDKLLLGYLILDFLLMFEHRTVTSIVREALFYGFVDVFLPYYVASRSLRNLDAFRDAMMSLVVAIMVLGCLLYLEFSRRWLLYGNLDNALGAPWGWSSYLVRGANLRASGTIGHAIAAGYVVAVGLGLYLYLRKSVTRPFFWWLGFAALVAGLIGPVSRGPWLGAVLMIVVFILTGPAAVTTFTRLGLALLVALPPLLLSPAGPTIIDHLPFIGTVDERNVIGRQLLAQVSYQVFWESPFLGRYDFVDTPAMQMLRGEDGQVDLVNTYVVVALGRGGVGLILFAGFFLSVLFCIGRGMLSVRDKGSDLYALGRGLFSTMTGVLLIIGTVSPVLMVPTVYWLLAGLGVGYAALTARAGMPAEDPARGPAAAPGGALIRGGLAQSHGPR